MLTLATLKALIDGFALAEPINPEEKEAIQSTLKADAIAFFDTIWQEITFPTWQTTSLRIYSKIKADALAQIKQAPFIVPTIKRLTFKSSDALHFFNDVKKRYEYGYAYKLYNSLTQFTEEKHAELSQNLSELRAIASHYGRKYPNQLTTTQRANLTHELAVTTQTAVIVAADRYGITFFKRGHDTPQAINIDQNNFFVAPSMPVLSRTGNETTRHQMSTIIDIELQTVYYRNLIRHMNSYLNIDEASFVKEIDEAWAHLSCPI